MESALIHRARLVVRAKGARTPQGEYPLTPDEGPWFIARLMERGGVNPASRRRTNSTDARVSAQYELLAYHTAEDGTPVVLTPSSVVETDCPILDSPTIKLAGRPEKLTNGVEHIGWMAYANVAKDAA